MWQASQVALARFLCYDRPRTTAYNDLMESEGVQHESVAKHREYPVL